MEKTKIAVPEGYGVGKIEVVDGEVIVTYKEKEPKLPKSWEEYCKEEYCTKSRYFIADESYVLGGKEFNGALDPKTDKNLLPNKETAEAVLALCQLIQLRECYNQGWRPDWNCNDQDKYVIEPFQNEMTTDTRVSGGSILHFKNDKLCHQFLESFRNMIEKLKPLYGIMKGGEE